MLNELKPEFIGQLGFYLTAVDETLKKKMINILKFATGGKFIFKSYCQTRKIMKSF